MTIIETIVTALSTGAVVALEVTAGQVVKDAYVALKGYLQRTYAGLHLQEVEANPGSEAWRAVLREELAKANAASDAALLQQAKALLDAIATQPPSAAVTGVDLADVRSASLTLRDIIAQGSGAVTGVKIKGATVDGPLEISGVRAGQSSNPTAASAPPIKILLLAANPMDTPPLRIDEEARAIDQALRASKLRNFTLLSHWAVRIDDLQELLLRHRPQIVHFSGHATEESEILLQDAVGNMTPVTADALRGLFALFNDNLRCVVLNACFAANQAHAIGAAVDCVVGMQEAVSDDAARAFAVAFYRGLGYGESVQRAFDLGRNELDLFQLTAEAQPRLIAQRTDAGAVYIASPAH